jgi:hypothetical protein
MSTTTELNQPKQPEDNEKLQKAVSCVVWQQQKDLLIADAVRQYRLHLWRIKM